jgi:F420-dependent oxidoreductase-like protein
MQTSVSVGAYGRTAIRELAEYVVIAERLGVNSVWSAEAWGHDAVTSLAYLAGKTERIRLGTGIMQISARVPSMTAMTALSMHDISEGRFILGLGVSGPQVVEGLHGSPYKVPLSRLKETVDILRMAFRDEKLAYEGKYHTLPLPGGEGKAIRLNHPPAKIPIFLATLAPKSLEFTGAAADGWLGTSFSPDHADAHLAYIRAGAEKAGRSMKDIELHASCSVAVGENVEEIIDARRPNVAFQMGAMGSAQTNFYNDAFQRAGFSDDAKAIQRLWIEGKRDEAARRVPDEMVTQFGAFGTPGMVRERFRAYEACGIDSLSLRIDPDASQRERIETLEQIMDLVPKAS